MKKILIALIFSVFSISLMAEESSNNNQENIKRNSFSIDFGIASNNNLVKSDYMGDNHDFSATGKYNHINGIDAKSNISITYLRKLNMLDNKLSFGAELQIFPIRTITNSYYNEDSYSDHSGDQHTNITSDSSKVSYGVPLNLMFLSQYELVKFKKFDLSVQAGIGMVAHYFYEKEYSFEIIDGVRKTLQDVEETYITLSPSAKIGLVGYYNINDSFAVGLSTNYVYTGKTKFENLDNYNYNFKNKGTLTANVSLKYMF